MMRTFSLVDEAWIPLRDRQGRLQHVGLLKALQDSHNYSMIEDANPLVVASLLRLLLALVHRIEDGPRSLRDRQALFEQPQLDSARVGSYLEQWRARFDLFGETPFYQVADLQVDKLTPLAKLAVEKSSGNNKALFEHSRDSAPDLLSFAEAARILVAHQAFSLCGGVSGGSLKNFTDSASPRGALLVVLGETLLQTLAANLLPYKDDDLKSLDLPAWERPPLTHASLKSSQEGPVLAGPCTLYTWQSRSVLLLAEDGGVRQCRYASGWVPVGQTEDPAMAYREGTEGLAPVRLQTGKAVWRDLCTLVPDAEEHRSQLIHTLCHDRALKHRLRVGGWFRLLVLGQSAKPGKPVVESWSSESLPLPEAWLEEQGGELCSNTRQALQYATDVRNCLREAIMLAARRLTDKEQAGRMFDSLNTEADYWAALHTQFFKLVQHFGEPEALQTWAAACRQEATFAYRGLEAVLGTDGAALRAWLAGRRDFLIKIKRLEEDRNMRSTVRA